MPVKPIHPPQERIWRNRPQPAQSQMGDAALKTRQVIVARIGIGR